jgi:hypothetical protein
MRLIENAEQCSAAFQGYQHRLKSLQGAQIFHAPLASREAFGVRRLAGNRADAALDWW